MTGTTEIKVLTPRSGSSYLEGRGFWGDAIFPIFFETAKMTQIERKCMIFLNFWLKPPQSYTNLHKRPTTDLFIIFKLFIYFWVQHYRSSRLQFLMCIILYKRLANVKISRPSLNICKVLSTFFVFYGCCLHGHTENPAQNKINHPDSWTMELSASPIILHMVCIRHYLGYIMEEHCWAGEVCCAHSV